MSEANNDSSSTTIVVVVILLLLGGFAGWWLWPRSAPPEPPPLVEVDAGTVADEPDEPEEPPTEVVKDIEDREALDGWLGVPGIVQRLAAATWRVSNGDSPAPVLGFLALSGRFDVRDEDDATYIDPASYARYEPIVERIVAVDPEQAAKAYEQLRPQFEKAFRQIAEPGQRFHGVAKKAVARVLAVEVPEGPIKIIGKGATFFYADEALESMAPADKHVLRLGSKNAERLQDWLRKVAAAADLQ